VNKHTHFVSFWFCYYHIQIIYALNCFYSAQKSNIFGLRSWFRFFFSITYFEIRINLCIQQYCFTFTFFSFYYQIRSKMNMVNDARLWFTLLLKFATHILKVYLSCMVAWVEEKTNSLFYLGICQFDKKRLDSKFSKKKDGNQANY